MPHHVFTISVEVAVDGGGHCDIGRHAIVFTISVEVAVQPH